MLANALILVETWLLPIVMAAALLALAFQRTRALMLIIVFLAAASSLKHQAFFFATTPWLLLLAASQREPTLTAPRLWLFIVLCALLGFGGVPALDAMQSVLWQWQRENLLHDFSLYVVGLATSLCLLRWVMKGSPHELGSAVMLLVALYAFAEPSVTLPRMALIGLACVSFIPVVLWAAYQMAFVDPLTGLKNRRALDERLSRGGWKLGVAMVDVDFFKKVNDRHGHDVGDRVLAAVARELARTAGCTAYRYGGEEFCLVFRPGALKHAGEIMERLRGRIEAMRIRQGKSHLATKVHAVRKGAGPGELKVTVSIGLASRSAETRTTEAVLKAADQALYKAKQRGRNCVVMA
jgi:diguanylate cyclase (GGDEF)-like protein